MLYVLGSRYQLGVSSLRLHPARFIFRCRTSASFRSFSFFPFKVACELMDAVEGVLSRIERNELVART